LGAIDMPAYRISKIWLAKKFENVKAVWYGRRWAEGVIGLSYLIYPLSGMAGSSLIQIFFRL
jgi:hypothetical protein